MLYFTLLLQTKCLRSSITASVEATSYCNYLIVSTRQSLAIMLTDSNTLPMGWTTNVTHLYIFECTDTGITEDRIAGTDGTCVSPVASISYFSQ